MTNMRVRMGVMLALLTTSACQFSPNGPPSLGRSASVTPAVVCTDQAVTISGTGFTSDSVSVLLFPSEPAGAAEQRGKQPRDPQTAVNLGTARPDASGHFELKAVMGQVIGSNGKGEPVAFRPGQRYVVVVESADGPPGGIGAGVITPCDP